MEAWRAGLLQQARLWLGTPWAHNQRTIGAGVDCGQFIIACYIGAGLVAPFETGSYPSDFMLHSEEERYLSWVEKYLDEVSAPQPGDVSAWRYGKSFSHGAMVVSWPSVIHAYARAGCVSYADATQGLLAREHVPGGGSVQRPVRYYSIAGRI